jgi:pyruvate-ferredoxin/flavodoxin oxidoreductase
MITAIKSAQRFVTIDGNEAAARVAYLASEVMSIYPITPASSMGELADEWAAKGKVNAFGVVPQVIEMQSEAGAAGALHGALQAGALTSTFTASQGLLLMIPEMYKIAGQLMPSVLHVAARSLATHALSIFGDHSDVMATRQTGWAMLCAASVQEAHDFSLVSHMTTLKSRVPFLHFFDGFRTSHEVNKIEPLDADDVRRMLDVDAIAAHRRRALDPDHPVLRGSAQNPDVFFQAREAVNPFYDAVPQLVAESMRRFEQLTGRHYDLFEYVGAPDASRVVVLMGSGCGAAEEAVRQMVDAGQKVGLIKVRLYRPFAARRFVEALPATVRRIAVLDRTKEPGAVGEPLYQDVVASLYSYWHDVRCQRHEDAAYELPKVVGGRYGLASKEFTPAMVESIFAQLTRPQPKPHFTIGIRDDVSGLSLGWDTQRSLEPSDVKRSVFFGLGSDGTVGASKSAVKIVGENTDLFAQGYFVYDSKKSGSITVSHLRFSPRPIESTYLVDRASFVSCSQFTILEQRDVLETAAEGATVLLNSPFAASEVWSYLPAKVQQQIRERKLKLVVIDAHAIARDLGLGKRINMVMLTGFFALADILPGSEAIEHVKQSIHKSYGHLGQKVVDQNLAAVDAAIDALQVVTIPDAAHDNSPLPDLPSTGIDFVDRVTRVMMAGRGDYLPVSAMPVDGTYPVGTAKFEKRNIAQELPIWDADICTQCGLCSLVCPHAAIRMKVIGTEVANGAPAEFVSTPWRDKSLPDHVLTIQVSPDDCTGCSVCVDVCPAKSKTVPGHKALDMLPKEDHHAVESRRWDYFAKLPTHDRTEIKKDSIKGSQLLLPLIEFSGACAGCGETPYLKLLTQLFGDRVMVANATGCSSIFGGNLPTTPWTTNDEGRGPAWCNSLFEDNAEFGLGMRLAVDLKRSYAEVLLKEHAGVIGERLVADLLAHAHDATEGGLVAQRERINLLKHKLSGVVEPWTSELLNLAEVLVARSVWIIGGDGWAYDIGFGGLDHVLATGHNVNVLVLDTGVYSNTGGQSSKATPRSAVARFAAGGKPSRKKDLGMLAMNYGNVYVAQIAMGANPAQTLRVLEEAESYPGPSLILAYSQCIAHGIDMATGMSHQKEVVQAGLWPLYHYDPRAEKKRFKLDSRRPTVAFAELASHEGRFKQALRANPEHAEELYAAAQADIDAVWQQYERLAEIE